MPRLLSVVLTLTLFLGRTGGTIGSALADPLDSEGVPNAAIEPALIDNFDQFTGPFFERFLLHYAPAPLILNDRIQKDYLFPTFFRNVTQAIAMFFCSYEKAKALLPDPALMPVSMGRGRALVVLSSFHYRVVMGMPSYNEVAVSIPVINGSRQDSPNLTPMDNGYEGLASCVVSMAVTARENQIRGVKLWGIPKVLAQIELKADGDDYVTKVHEPSGAVYLTFRVPRSGSRKTVEQMADVYSVKDGRLMKARTHMTGQFVKHSFPLSLVTSGKVPAQPFVELGTSPSAQVLKNLELRSCPFQLWFATGVSSCFDLPHPVNPPR
jgi:hypothetical protein